MLLLKIIDDAESHSTSRHLKLLTKHIMRRFMMLFLYRDKDEAYKYNEKRASKKKPLPSKGLNKWDHIISIHHDHIHPYPSSTDMNNHHTLLQGSLVSQNNSDKGQGHTKVLGGIARTAPLALNVLLCWTVCVWGMLVPDLAQNVDLDPFSK